MARPLSHYRYPHVVLRYASVCRASDGGSVTVGEAVHFADSRAEAEMIAEQLAATTRSEYVVRPLDRQEWGQQRVNSYAFDDGSAWAW